MLPDVSELPKTELFDTTMLRADGSHVQLYSSYRYPSVYLHFKWMRDYGIDGVMLQRFSGETATLDTAMFRNQVMQNVRYAAQKYGRVFNVMWDITDDPGYLAHIEKDWPYLVDRMKVTESDRYLRHKGKPLVCIWGLGFDDRPGTADEAIELIHFFRDNPNPRYRATIMGGVPTYWRNQVNGVKGDPRWHDIFLSLDVLSPWTVGRFSNLKQVDAYSLHIVEKDVRAMKNAGHDFMPVIFPGSSFHNGSRNEVATKHKAVESLNGIPRNGGDFYWRQVYDEMSAGCTMLYGAMFDEVNEGTAIYKVVADKNLLPLNTDFITTKSDGYDLPGDWYLRLAGEATRMLQGKIPLSADLPLDRGDPHASDGLFVCPKGP
jgi:hypothetical protein